MREMRKQERLSSIESPHNKRWQRTALRATAEPHIRYAEKDQTQ